MDAFDKVEELLLAEGYSKEEIPAIMVSLIEQGMSPAEIISRGMVGLANMGLSGLEGADRLLKRLPQKRKPEPLPKTKSVPSLLPDKLQPQAPKPEFGNNAARPQPRVPKPELRPGGQTPAPEFKVTQSRPNAGGAVNIPRTNANTRVVQPQAPVPKFGTSTATPPVSQATNLFGRLKGVRGSLASTALNLATAGAIDKYVVKPTGNFLGTQLAKGIISATGQEKLYPNLYGKQGPTLGVDTIKSIRARDAEAAKNAVSGQRTNEIGQQSSLPSSGDPSTFPKGNKQPKALSPAAKDFDANFAAARKAGKKEFTWRGKQYHTRLKGE